MQTNRFGYMISDLDKVPSIADILASVAGSTYGEPKAVEAAVEYSTFQIVITSVHAVFLPSSPFPGMRPDDHLGLWDEPDFVAFGFIPPDGFDPYTEIVWVRLVITNRDAEGTIEQIPRPPRPRLPADHSGDSLWWWPVQRRIPGLRRLLHRPPRYD